MTTRSKAINTFYYYQSLTHKRALWEQVYAIVEGVDDLVGQYAHLSDWRTTPRDLNDDGYFQTTYYQTYGGGPEGGYFLCYFIYDDGRKELTSCAKVERTWGEPFRIVKRPMFGARFSIKKRDGLTFIKMSENIKYQSAPLKLKAATYNKH